VAPISRAEQLDMTHVDVQMSDDAPDDTAEREPLIEEVKDEPMEGNRSWAYLSYLHILAFTQYTSYK
jgi:hypothetical protein